MACVPTVAKNNVRPSGLALAAASAPIVPPAPARLSTMTTNLSASPSSSTKGRAAMSLGQPDGNGTIKRICIPATGCATPVPARVKRPAVDAAKALTRNRRRCIAYSPLRFCLSVNHSTASAPSPWGHQQRFRDARVMSTLPPKADMLSAITTPALCQ